MSSYGVCAGVARDQADSGPRGGGGAAAAGLRALRRHRLALPDGAAAGVRAQVLPGLRRKLLHHRGHRPEHQPGRVPLLQGAGQPRRR